MTRVRTADNRQAIVYHGGPEGIETFKPFTHFGTEQAAQDRIAHRTSAHGRHHLYAVHLNIRYPFPCRDSGEAHDHIPCTAAYLRQYAGWPSHIGPEIRRRFTEALLAHGYDGIVYVNAQEDRGSVSWVALHANQISPVKQQIETPFLRSLWNRVATAWQGNRIEPPLILPDNIYADSRFNMEAARATSDTDFYERDKDLKARGIDPDAPMILRTDLLLPQRANAVRPFPSLYVGG